MTYDLRRFKHRGLISRIPGTHRYRVTDLGLDTAKIPHHRPRPHPDHRLGRTRHHTTNPKPPQNSRNQLPQSCRHPLRHSIIRGVSSTPHQRSHPLINKHKLDSKVRLRRTETI